jgi:hypothetical protein
MLANVQEIGLLILALGLIVGGVISCVLPPLPGAVVAFVGLIVGKFIPAAELDWLTIGIWGVVVVIVSVGDNLLSLLAVKRAGGTRAAIWGGIAGLLIGFFSGPLGVLLFPLLGAIAGEWIVTSEFRLAMRSGWWSFMGLLLGMATKVAVCLSMGAFLVLKVVGAW